MDVEFASIIIPDALRALAQEGVPRHYRKNAQIINEGDRGGSLFILLEGSVRIYSQDEQGRELDFGLLEAGTVFGEMALEGTTRTASVEAVSSCLCAEVSYATLKARLAGDPDFALFLISTLIARSRSAVESAKSLALKSVYQRVIELLKRESVLENGVRMIPRKMAQQSIAKSVGSSRDMVSKIFKDLVSGQYIDVDANHIKILKDLPKRW